jgi:hypothetical protein
MQQHDSEDLLDSIRDTLIPDRFSHKEQLRDYQRQLQARLTFKNLATFSLDNITNDEAYKAWRQSEQSRTIILRGQTQARIRSPLSWLSPAAVELIERLHKEEGDNTTIVYHFCKRESMADDDLMQVTIARIIYQLLEAQPSMLQDRATYQDYTTRLKSDRWQQKHLKTACELCVDILNHFERVYLILDRPEECRSGISGLSILLEEAQEAKCVLKTFIVVEKDRTKSGEVNDWRDAASPGTMDIIDNLDQK